MRRRSVLAPVALLLVGVALSVAVGQNVARTADLVLKLAALAERYESRTGSADRVAAMRDVVSRGRRQLAELAGVDVAGVDVAGLEPATSRV